MNIIDSVYLSFHSIGQYLRKHYTDIPDYQKLMAGYGMPDIPDLWGIEGFYEAQSSPLSEMPSLFKDSLMETDFSDESGEDVYIVCSTNAGDSNAFLVQCNEVIAQIRGSKATEIFYLASTGCTNIFNGIELGVSLLNCGKKRIFIVASDVGSKYDTRFTNHALFSDYCCVITLSKESNLPFKLHTISNLSNLDLIGDKGIESFDTINKVNFERVNAWVDLREVSAIYPMNNFKPITLMKYKKLGYPQDVVYTASITARGHCGGADPFMSMVEDKREYSSGATFLLNAQSEGRSSILLASRN